MADASTPRATVLVVDDHRSNVKAVRAKLEVEGYRVVEAASGREALDLFDEQRPDLVLLDIMMPGMDGYETCRRMKAREPGGFTPVILVTAKAETDALVEGFEAGADDYVTKPFKPIELMARVRAMLRIRDLLVENAFLKEEVARDQRFDSILGESADMKRVLMLAGKVARRDVTVLLVGETGTGKEAFARAIHYEGARSGCRFVAVNCGALPETLLESELFGHRKGSFTGATDDKIGLLEAADGGTVFLDEIGETSPAMQVKLLRFLEEGEVTRVGDVEPRKIDVRVIAATNRDLAEEIEAGRFREDLFYRLNVFPIRLPPLRKRRDDIPLLARHFLQRYAGEFRQRCPGFTKEAMATLVEGDWPGNVRELANEVQRALVLATPGEPIGPAELSGRAGGPAVGRTTRPGRGLLRAAIEDVEREMIARTLEAHEGNKSHMAAELGISRWTLLKKMRAYGLEPEEEEGT